MTPVNFSSPNPLHFHDLSTNALVDANPHNNEPNGAPTRPSGYNRARLRIVSRSNTCSNSLSVVFLPELEPAPIPQVSATQPTASARPLAGMAKTHRTRQLRDGQTRPDLLYNEVAGAETSAALTTRPPFAAGFCKNKQLGVSIARTSKSKHTHRESRGAEQSWGLLWKDRWNSRRANAASKRATTPRSEVQDGKTCVADVDATVEPRD
uniref:Uncharacterized protein n=1 Tax=Mycena chlorophos TaxID=658473 RepID=A0ABQ0LU58_MYCCL|nr:predicted protein [Mycena chlorophos]